MNRYARDWDEYSRQWDAIYGPHGQGYAYLGDEWNDDGAPERKRDHFRIYAERFLQPEMTVLEIGPGGRKWTVLIAPKVKRLIALDVSQEMIARTRRRCEQLGITNVEYVLGNGRDFSPVPDESIDFFRTYAVGRTVLY